MNKNFVDIVSNVALEVRDTSSVMKSLIKTYANNRYSAILKVINWRSIVPDYTITTVAGTKDYVLPDDFGKEINATDTTNGIELSRVDLESWLSSNSSSISLQGDVNSYSIIDDTVMEQPTSASVITLVSSSASDTSQSILVKGISSGVEIVEAVTLTGATNALTTNQFTTVKGISKSATTVGKITATSNSGAVTTAVLSPSMTNSYYKKIRLHYNPTNIIVIALPYIRKHIQMVDDYDYPIIDIDNLIELGSKADAFRYKREFQKASVFEGLYSSSLSDYIWDKSNQPNEVQQFTPKVFNRDNLY